MKSSSLVFGVLLFLFLLGLNWLFLPISDDYAFYFLAQQKPFLWNYFHWNARVGELILSGFLGQFVNSLIFDWLNAAFGVLFVFVYFFLYQGSLPSMRTRWLFLLFLACVFLLSCFGSVFLWGAGSTNYVWGLSLVGIVLIPYRIFLASFFQEGTKGHVLANSPYWLALLPIALLAGMASEHIGFMLSLCFVLCVALLLFKKIRIPLFFVPLGLCFVLGYLCLYFSPAASIRIQNFLTLKDLFALPLHSLLYHFNFAWNRFYSPSYVLFLGCFLLWWAQKKQLLSKKIHFVYLAIALLALLVFSRHVFALGVYGLVCWMIWDLARIKRLYLVFLFCFGAWSLLGGVVVQIGYLPARARLGDSLILWGLVLWMMRDFLILAPIWTRRFIAAFFGFSCVMLLGWFALHIKEQNQKLQLLKAQREQGATQIILPKEKHYRYFQDWGALSEDPNHDQNQNFAAFFGVGSVVAR